MYTELLVRTTHVLLAIEKSMFEKTSHTGKAVVFGSFVTETAT